MSQTLVRAPPPAVRPLGPTRQLVWVHLAASGQPLSAGELADKTGWTAKTCRGAAKELTSEGHAAIHPDGQTRRYAVEP